MRKPMITRTIITTEATVLCVDIANTEPFNKTVTLPRTYKDEKSLMKAAEAVINTDTVKAVAVVTSNVNEQLYGMTEQDFISLAHPINTTKAIKNI